MQGLRDQLDTALKLQQTGHAAAAKSIYENILAIDQNIPDANHLLGLIYFSDNKLKEAEIFVSKATNLNPHNHSFIMNLGVIANAQGKYERAKELFIEALDLKPDFIDSMKNLAALHVHFNELDAAEKLYLNVLEHAQDKGVLLSLAELYRTLGKNSNAIRLYTRYCNEHPNDSDTYFKMGLVYNALDERDNAIWAYTMSIRNNPQNVGAYNNLGTIYLVENRIEQAVEYFSHAQSIHSDDAPSGWNLAKCYFLQGELRSAWKKYYHRWSVFGAHYMSRSFQKPEWRGEDISGKTILLYNEQGIGDHIQNIRFISRLKKCGARVIMETHPSVTDLFTNDFKGDVLYTYGEECPEYDLHCSFNSLPERLNVSIDDVLVAEPYIRTDSFLSSQWKQKLSRCNERLKVGVVWAGNSKHPNDSLRSCSLHTFKGLFDVDDIAFINLQVGDESNRFPSDGKRLYDFSTDLTDYNQTAAVIENLDLVISVDTSVVHLCGAMKKPVWVLTAFNPDWRWMLNRSDSYWYSSVRLFRQTRMGDWNSVIAEVVSKLKNFEK